MVPEKVRPTKEAPGDVGASPGLLEAKRWPVTSDKKELEFPRTGRWGDQKLAVAAVVTLVLGPAQTGQVSWRQAASQNIHS